MPAILRACVLAALCMIPAFGADPGKDLLNAARSGDVPGVKRLLASGAPTTATDKKGRTPLMLAASKGQVEIVRLLLQKGADPQARDKDGFTAYGLAVFDLGGSERDAVLAALPKPPRLRLNAVAAWIPENMVSSCFQTRSELAKLIGDLHPDALVLGALANYARSEGLDLVEFVTSETKGLLPQPATPSAAPGADAVVALNVRPGASCVRQSDNLSLAIDVRVARASAGAPVFEKTYGGGLKGLHAQPVTNPAQYPPFYEKWAKSHADSIYWGVVKALMRSK